MKTLRTLKDLRNDPRVDSVWHEDDGGTNHSSWWALLKPGWMAYGNYQHSVHEDTIKGVCDVVNCCEEWIDDPELKTDLT